MDSSDVETLAPECRRYLGESVVAREMAYTRLVTPGAGNLLVHRSVFAQVGTFDEAAYEGGEDTEWYSRVRRANISAWYTPRAVVHHEVPETRRRREYCLLAAERNGWHIARREVGEYGRLFPAVYLARCGQGLFVHLPLFALTRLTQSGAQAVGKECLVKRSKGYLECGLTLLFPRRFRGLSQKRRLGFRENR